MKKVFSQSDSIKDQHKDIAEADDVIAKPFHTKLLEKKIGKFLKRTG